MKKRRTLTSFPFRESEDIVARTQTSTPLPQFRKSRSTFTPRGASHSASAAVTGRSSRPDAARVVVGDVAGQFGGRCGPDERGFGQDAGDMAARRDHGVATLQVRCRHVETRIVERTEGRAAMPRDRGESVAVEAVFTIAIRSRAASQRSSSADATSGATTSSGAATRLTSGRAISAAIPVRAFEPASPPTNAANPRRRVRHRVEHAADDAAPAAVLEEAVDGIGKPPIRRDEGRPIDEPAERLLELRPATDQRGCGRPAFGDTDESREVSVHALDRAPATARLGRPGRPERGSPACPPW